MRALRGRAHGSSMVGHRGVRAGGEGLHGKYEAWCRSRRNVYSTLGSAGWLCFVLFHVLCAPCESRLW